MFQVPPLNVYAKDYIDLIDWQQSKITEPPLTRHMTEEDIASHIEWNHIN